MATLAPDSARACATARPMPAPAPDTIAVLPLLLKSGSTFFSEGGLVLLWTKSPPLIEAFAMTVGVEYEKLKRKFEESLGRLGMKSERKTVVGRRGRDKGLKFRWWLYRLGFVRGWKGFKGIKKLGLGEYIRINKIAFGITNYTPLLPQIMRHYLITSE